jgi:hypothetical protein
MVEKIFAEVPVGTNFTVNGLEYTKTETVKVSCCQSINAHLADNSTARVFFQDSVVVTVNA